MPKLKDQAQAIPAPQSYIFGGFTKLVKLTNLS